MAAAKSAPALSAMEEFRLAKAIANAAPWMPADNPDQAVIEGTVIGLDVGRDNGYGEYPVVVYKLHSYGPDAENMTAADQYIKVHAFHTLLRNQLAELKTDIGSHQILSYDGLKRKNNATDEEIDKGLADYHLTFVMNVGQEVKAKADNFAF